MRTLVAVATGFTVLTVLGTSCSPLSFATTPAPTGAETVTPTAGVFGPLPVQTVIETLGPFVLDLTPQATPTALPPLELPTQAPFPGGPAVWDGLPTYPAESSPDYYFRVSYDPGLWALVTDHFGYPALANRELQGCILAPAAGRGLPPGGTADHQVRRIGGVTFQISAAAIGGEERFVTYAGGNGVIYTAFEVALMDPADACLAAAEAVLGTLTSVPAIEATPIVIQ